MKYWWMYIVALLAVGLFLGLLAVRSHDTNTVALLGNTIHVTRATTPEARQQGLSGRTGLAPDEGLLFVFEQEGNYSFWMKDMRFSIDILWIDSAGTIVYIEPSVSPDTYPQSFDPKANALYVLELPAGYAVAHDVVVGDVVRIK